VVGFDGKQQGRQRQGINQPGTGLVAQVLDVVFQDVVSSHIGNPVQKPPETHQVDTMIHRTTVLHPTDVEYGLPFRINFGVNEGNGGHGTISNMQNNRLLFVWWFFTVA